MTLTDMQTPFYRIKEADLLYDIDYQMSKK